jgi:hypothetical protein
MINFTGSPQDAGSFAELLKRITQGVKAGNVEKKLTEVLGGAFDTELDRQHVVLSRPERKRLFDQVAKAVLTEIIDKLDKPA